MADEIRLQIVTRPVRVEIAPIGAQGAKGDAGATGPQGPTGAAGQDGAPGADGASAYEVAVANGFVGNEAAWLASLVGADGADGANGADGADGAAGVDGTDGAPLNPRGTWSGAATYERLDLVSLNGSSWVALRTNTNVSPIEGADWTLNASKGDAGATGPQGPQGDPGPAGADGDDGAPGADGADAIVGVDDGTYGDATHVAAITVSGGQITGIEEVEVTGAGGASGDTFSYFDVNKPPASPSALDDEMADGPTLDVKWTQVNAAAVTVDVNSTVDDALYVLVPASMGDFASFLQALPAGDFHVVIPMYLSSRHGDYAYAGLQLTDGVTDGAGTQLFHGFVSDAGIWRLYTQTGTNFNAPGTTLIGAGAGDTWPEGQSFIHIRRASGTYYFGASTYGQGPTELTAVPGFTPTHVGLGFLNTSSTPFTVVVPWFRYFASATAKSGGLRVVGSPESLVTAKGDIVVGDASGDPAPLPVGANGTRLQADSAQSAGMKWTNIGVPLIVVKSADETVTASTTLQDDNELLFAIGANETWHFRIVIHYAGHTSGDLKLAVTAPAGATKRWYYDGFSGSVSGGSGSLAMNSGVNDALSGFLGAQTSLDARSVAEGVVANGATPGNVVLQWAQNASNGTPTTVYAKSFLFAMRVS